jgi:capsular polysaccharide biosynthesis protein
MTGVMNIMATAPAIKKSATPTKSETARAANSNGSGAKKTPTRAAKPQLKRPAPRSRPRANSRMPEVPTWLAAVASAIGVGVAVGAGLYATRHQWMSKAQEWRDDFSAAFADDETDSENFDQTRHAGPDSMRDNPGDDWEDIDDMSDASFPASDPPSFNPGTA